KEYQKFQPDSVNGSKDTKELKRSIEKEDNRIVVTTIQKLNEFVKKNPAHEIYEKHCVLIYDECHRSQFGEAQKNIRKAFKNYYQFGFTGTPIFPENALGSETTAGVFGAQLHSYVITDAIRDGKVLKFKVDYNNISAKFKEAETEYDEKELKKLERKMLLHPERITEVTRHILSVFDTKTHRNEHYDLKNRRLNGFNAMFAVQSVEAAKCYYEEFQKQQSELTPEKQLKIATIYSFAANEEQSAIGEIVEENFEPNVLDLSAKEFLEQVIEDYNKCFATNFSTNGNDFQNYYKDLSLKVKNKEIDLLIVVGMFLTGFDAPTLNTLFVDKNLRYHGLIQAFSRTNRILNKVKKFGNIVCFRDLENATKEAIKLFGDENSVNVILERSYHDYLFGFEEEETGQAVTGYVTICNQILDKFNDPTEIIGEADKKEFVTLFGELLKAENILRNFDEFESFEKIISERQMQDMKSAYVDIREEVLSGRQKENGEKFKIDFSDIEFQIELLKTDEINLDYILALILEKSKVQEDTEALKSDIRRLIRSSLGTRAKEELIIDFVNETDLANIQQKEEILSAFYEYAKKKKELKIKEIIESEKLKEDSKRFIEKAIEKGYATSMGTELDSFLPPTSRRQGAREAKKQSILQKIQEIVEVFLGI
ncbi:MAG: HsdR family type I site-specific deoxyribonuclease, partial [Eubacteriales bacterium]|nr:HsdR family type I site-specific deoxyribonuclease [Eubacteriales bacterium]